MADATEPVWQVEEENCLCLRAAHLLALCPSAPGDQEPSAAVMSYDRGHEDRGRDFRGGDGRDYRGDHGGAPRGYGPPRDFRGGDSRDYRGGPGGGGPRDFRGDRDFRGGRDRDFRPGYGGPPRGRRDDGPSGGAGHLTRIFGTEEDRCARFCGPGGGCGTLPAYRAHSPAA